MIAKPESFSRWPISPADRQEVIEILLEIVANGSPMHQIRAAKTLLEMDQSNRENEVAIDFDAVKRILEERQKEESK